MMSNNIFDPRTGYPVFWEHEANNKIKTLPPLEILNFCLCMIRLLGY